jgi:hypothetical protein
MSFIEELSSIIESINDLDNSIGSERDVASGQNHESEKTTTEEESINIAGQNGTKIIEKNNELEQDGIDEKPDGEVVDIDPLIVLENSTTPTHQAQVYEGDITDDGVSDKQQDENLGFLPEFDIFGRNTDESIGYRFKKRQERGSRTPTDNNCTFLKDLREATDRVMGLHEKKANENISNARPCIFRTIS